ncbi:glycosyl hydrolase [Plectosphaerella cucumerina]|uniref:Glycosyl hydrolase n=1 Tax=Plectosphaerella cucumerina TaxID=40658 RepID=A0A8K0T7W8_9PEZI|nr:glycosyl hydrolase [Plectosphaerella cucumerina]
MAPSLEVDELDSGGFLTEYQNPIIPGFAPDPSVVLVDGVYYLVTSSFHIFPGIAIYASRDLKSWTHISNAITRKSQVDLTQTLTKAVPLADGHTMIGAGGLFAPTIRYHNGTFYIICTNVGCEGADFEASNFYITTTDITAGDWSDPIPVDLHGIDPSLFIDDDGRAYVQGSWRLPRTEQPTSTIKQWEINLKTGERIGETREIWTGHSCIYTEGPHIYRKDGWYYLLVAEGGTFEHHHLSLARSKSIWGPYEGCPSNPVLTGEGKNELVQDAGHGELFQDADGLWWATVLGVRKYGDGSRYPLGRESFLTPVDWPVGEWPVLHHPRETFKRTLPRPPTKGATFPSHTRVADCYIRTPDLENYKWSADGTVVSMQSSSEDLTVAVGTSSFVGKRQRRLDGATAETTLSLAGLDRSRPLRAGLAVYKDDFRHAAISFEASSSSVVLSLRNNAPEDTRIASASVATDATALAFRLSTTLKRYQFEYCVEGPGGKRPWVVLGEVDTTEMTARDFTGTILGVYAHHGGREGREAQWVTFEGLEIDT